MACLLMMFLAIGGHSSLTSDRELARSTLSEPQDSQLQLAKHRVRAM
jgi:hypothetical protein